jgi:hypothetical protein|nr:MAG TPA: hypothetical protein [Caudoviricetes sp.]
MQEEKKEIVYDYVIESWLPVFTGFKNTSFSIPKDSIIYQHNRWLDVPVEKNRFVFDEDDYKDKLSNEVVEFVENELEYIFGFVDENTLEFEMEYKRLYSPEDYDLLNDTIFVEYKFQQEIYDWIREYITDRFETFKSFAKHYYTVKRDEKVFSSYPDDLDEWIEDYDKMIIDTKHGLGLVLSFILYNESYLEKDLYRQVIPVIEDVTYQITEEK